MRRQGSVFRNGGRRPVWRERWCKPSKIRATAERVGGRVYIFILQCYTAGSPQGAQYLTFIPAALRCVLLARLLVHTLTMSSESNWWSSQGVNTLPNDDWSLRHSSVASRVSWLTAVGYRKPAASPKPETRSTHNTSDSSPECTNTSEFRTQQESPYQPRRRTQCEWWASQVGAALKNNNSKLIVAFVVHYWLSCQGGLVRRLTLRQHLIREVNWRQG